MTPEYKDVTPYLSLPLIMSSGQSIRIRLHNVRRHAFLQFMVTGTCTSVVVAACALVGPVYTSKATVSCSVLAVGSTISDPFKRNDVLVELQQQLITTDPVVHPAACHYRLLQRRHQPRSGWCHRLFAVHTSTLYHSPIDPDNVSVTLVKGTSCITIIYSDRDLQSTAGVAITLARSYLLSHPGLSTKLRHSLFNANADEEMVKRLAYSVNEPRSPESATDVVTTGLGEYALGGGLQIVDPRRAAAVPSFLNWPIMIIAATGVFGSTTLTCIAARGTANATAKSAELVREASGLDVICSLPRVDDFEHYVRCGTKDTLVHGFSLDHVFFGECIKVIQQTVALTAQSRLTPSVLFVSSVPAEGTTSIAVCVAMAFANQGKRTLLIDADSSRPMIERSLPLKASGRPNYFDDDRKSWQVTLSDVDGCPHLFVLSMNEKQSVFRNLGKAVRRIIREAAPDFDIVLIDASPLDSADSIDLARLATSTVIVARHARTPLASIVNSVQALRHLNVIPAGIVLYDCTGLKDGASLAYSKY